jgi:sterol desaturase/sphingolipid hydroxylase (fatty acid hydroxylase superfamily)
MAVFPEKPLDEMILLQWAMNLSRYFVFAGLAWWIFWRWGAARFRTHRLYPPPTAAQRHREIRYSVLTTLIFLPPFAAVLIGARAGWVKAYADVAEHGWLWLAISFFVVLIWHETYFYWIHRAMHSRMLFRRFHRVHHESREPSPFAAFSFHPLEAFLESLPFLMLVLFVPVHVGVLFAFTFFSLAMNVLGHLGLELVPERKRDRAPWRFVNTASVHAWHHAKLRGNYGLYSTIWDRWMGTYRKPGELWMGDSTVYRSRAPLIEKNPE